VTANTDPSLQPHQTFDIVERSILVACTGEVAGTDTGAAPPPGGAPSGSITPPDTGSAGQAARSATWWSLVALGVAGTMLAAGTWATRSR
jgi:hypothetical protein